MQLSGLLTNAINSRLLIQFGKAAVVAAQRGICAWVLAQPLKWFVFARDAANKCGAFYSVNTLCQCCTCCVVLCKVCHTAILVSGQV
jgi:hypothetical protein